MLNERMNIMFSLHAFIMNTLKGMLGYYPQAQIQKYALNWYEKPETEEGKLTLEDIATVESWFIGGNDE